MAISPIFNKWCIAWSAIGISAALFSTRTDKAPSGFLVYYVLYYGFALAAVSIAAFVTASKIFNSSSQGIEFQAAAALVGLVGGFSSPRLHDIALSRASK